MPQMTLHFVNARRQLLVLVVTVGKRERNEVY
jgi:hypothetical protein